MKTEQERRRIPRRYMALCLVALLLLCACAENRTLEESLESGTITVITCNNAHCYYTYRDQEMGLEYDLAKAFAGFLGVKLKLAVAKSTDQLLRAIDKGKGDVGAASMAITPSRSERADFSRGYLTVKQVVVTQRKNTRIKRVEDLAGKTVHVIPGSAHDDSLTALKRGGLDVKIVRNRTLSVEGLIKAVARGEIEITVADSHVALLNRRYYPDVRIAFSLGEPKSIGWAVKKGEKALLERINAFFETIREDGTFDDIYNRYHAYVERFDHLDIKRFLERTQTHLPQYEKPIKSAAQQHGIDWRLIAALIYQESQFNPWARSFAGARGLMQLTEATAEEMGVKNRLNPQESILGGVGYLKQLHDLYDAADEPDRTLIALAAYNVGKAHIIDARELAKKKNLDPDKWSSLEKTLPLLCQPQYYNKSRYGFCSGTQPVSHVQQILTYYDILKREAIEYTDVEEISG